MFAAVELIKNVFVFANLTFWGCSVGCICDIVVYSQGQVHTDAAAGGMCRFAT
jgi:hypothetical protein